MKSPVIGVGGMTCQGCAKSVGDVLQELPGVVQLNVSLDSGNASVVYDETLVEPERFKKAIEDAGFDAAL